MRRIHWVLAGLALAIGAGALAQIAPSGFPSSPIFQRVTVNTGAGSNIDVCNSAGASNNKCFNIRSGGSGSTFAVTAESDVHVLGTNALQITRNSGLSTISQVAIGDATDKPTVTINGITVPKIVTAQMSVTSSSCSVTTSQNMASCTRTATGTFQANFAQTYSTAPVCTAVQGPGATGGVQSIGGMNPTTTTATMTMLSTSNAAIDASTSIQLICVGV